MSLQYDRNALGEGGISSTTCWVPLSADANDDWSRVRVLRRAEGGYEQLRRFVVRRHYADNCNINDQREDLKLVQLDL